MHSRRTAACFLISLFWLAPSFPGLAQDKAEEPPRWKGDVALGLSLARGNTQSSNFSMSFGAGGPVGQNLALETHGLYLFAEADDETSAESGLLAGRLKWDHTARFFSYYEVQAIRDRFKNYSYRLMPAVGVGYKIIDRAALNLTVDAGLDRVLTKYYDTGETDGFTGLKGGQALVWKISETAEFNEKAEITGDLSDFGRHFLRLEANLITAIAKSWAVKLTVIDSYDSRPVGAGIKKNDIVMVAAISRKF